MGIGIIQQRDAYSLHALKFLTSLLANITVTILFFSNHTAAKSFMIHAQFWQRQRAHYLQLFHANKHVDYCDKID